MENTKLFADTIKDNFSKNDFLERELGYRNLFEQSPNGTAIINTDGTIKSTNDCLCTMLGYTPGELSSKSVITLAYKEDKEIIKNNFQRFINNDAQTINQVIRYAKRDSSFIWVKVTSTVLKDSHGKLQHIIGTVEDITQKRINDLTRKIVYNISNAIDTTNSLEELIVIIKNQLSTLIDTTNFYVAIYNEKDQTFSLPYYHDEFDDEENYTSFPAEKSISAYLYETKSPLLATPDILEELENQDKIKLVGPPSKIWLGIPLIFKGVCFGVMAVQSYKDAHAFSVVDLELLEHVSQQISISIARKKSEEELNKALEYAKQADRVKSAFLSTMSHELRTPLNAVIGFSEIIKNETKCDDAKAYADIIYTSGNHLLELVEGLFDITLIEAGTIKIKKEDIHLHTLLSEIEAIINAERIRMNIKNVEVTLEFSVDKNLVIHTDRTKLKQIFINLLKNALKFTPKGQISFGCYNEQSNKKKSPAFFVKDTGIGIPSNKLDYIFKSFNQIDNAHSRNHDGAGIGLSVAKELTGLLGGEINVSSKEGEGSEFKFTIASGR